MGGQIVVDRDVLRNHSQPPKRRRITARLLNLSVNQDLSGIRYQATGNGTNERRLARSIRSQECKAFTLVQRKRSPIQSRAIAKPADKVIDN